MDLLSGIASWVAGAFGMGGEANWGQNANTKAKNRIPVYDLHGVHAGNVKKGEERFLRENRKASHVKIITGRGLHSKDGRPVNKIITQKYLKDNGYNYSVKDKGGSVIVNTRKVKS